MKILNEQQYRTALRRVEELFDVEFKQGIEPNTDLGRELEQLICALEEYENVHYPIN